MLNILAFKIKYLRLLKPLFLVNIIDSSPICRETLFQLKDYYPNHKSHRSFFQKSMAHTYNA